MFSGLDESQLKGALEAMLFVTDEPVNTITLADMLEVEPAEIEMALVDLRSQFEEENRGIQLREVAGGWRLFTHPVYHDLIERYVLSWDTRKLSQAAMETLAIVAYGQPITRAGVASVRGVNSDSSVNSLVEKGLLREVGTEESPGNPVLYATSRTFLEKFGLRSVEDLPDISQYAPDDETRDLIRERLSATRTSSIDIVETDEFEGLEIDFDEAMQPNLSRIGDSFGATADGAADAEPAQESTDAPAGEAEGIGQLGTQALLAEALASSLGVVEKIDFDDLQFEE